MLISVLAIHGSWKLYYVYCIHSGSDQMKVIQVYNKRFLNHSWKHFHKCYFIVHSIMVLLFFFYLHICPFIIIKVSKGEVGELCINAGLTEGSQE